MTYALLRAAALVMVTGLLPPAAADTPRQNASSTANPSRGLKHDPFARPTLALEAPPGAPEPWSPSRIGIVMAGKKSAVNVDGDLIRIGEDKDGYRLVRVGEREAVFTRGGKRIVISIDMPPKEQK